MLPLVLGLLSLTALAGCFDNSPPPSRVPVPAPANQDYPITRRTDPMRPMPPQPEYDEPIGEPPPFYDAPLVSQQPPEQPAFISAYRRVNSPRIVLFVNRTLEGNIIPITNPSNRVRQTNTTVHNDPYYPYNRTTEKHITDTYLKPGQYDEVNAKSLDYEAIENIMTDWLACNGQVTVVSPTVARQRLTDQQVRDLQQGRPQVASELAQQLNADVLVQVQAHPTKQTQQGLHVRLVAEAINVKGGESIGRAVVDMQPPLEKTTINRYTRFLARKLMDGMIGTWNGPPPPGMQQPQQAPPQTPPPQPPPQQPSQPLPPFPGQSTPPTPAPTPPPPTPEPQP
jgi:hypothetical protein